MCDPSLPHQVLLHCGEASGSLPKPNADELLRAMVDLIGTEPIDGIVVVNQAQSFTLIRVVATIANALAYSLNVPLYSIAHAKAPLEQPVARIEPHYSAAPNITPAKHAI